MESIAREGQVAKATVFGHLPDKEAAFLAVAERMPDQLSAAFEAVLAKMADLDLRIADALVSKHKTVCESVRRSARELFGAQAGIAGPVFGPWTIA
jgi:AcrR family transcriptional regulator